MGTEEYNPCCFDCRKEAGRHPAGVLPEMLCYSHLRQRYNDLKRRVSEARRRFDFSGVHPDFVVRDNQLYAEGRANISAADFDRLLPEGKEE